MSETEIVSKEQVIQACQTQAVNCATAQEECEKIAIEFAKMAQNYSKQGETAKHKVAFDMQFFYLKTVLEYKTAVANYEQAAIAAEQQDFDTVLRLHNEALDKLTQQEEQRQNLQNEHETVLSDILTDISGTTQSATQESTPELTNIHAYEADDYNYAKVRISRALNEGKLTQTEVDNFRTAFAKAEKAGKMACGGQNEDGSIQSNADIVLHKAIQAGIHEEKFASFDEQIQYVGMTVNDALNGFIANPLSDTYCAALEKLDDGFDEYGCCMWNI